MKNQKTTVNNFSMEDQQSAQEQEFKSYPVAPDSYRDGWKRWLNYQSIVKQIPFFLFLACLAVLYIFNGHFADNTIRKINRTAKEVKELQYEYKTIKSEVMFRSRQSELAKAVEPLGLKELTGSPVVLKEKVEEEKN